MRKHVERIIVNDQMLADKIAMALETKDEHGRYPEYEVTMYTRRVDVSGGIYPEYEHTLEIFIREDVH